MLIGALLILVVTYVLVVPFRAWEFHIDRQTGKWSCTVTWYGLVKVQRPISNPTWHDSTVPSRLTAPARSIAIGRRTQAFPWSPMSLLHPEFPGVWYAEAFSQLFNFQRSPGTGARQLPALEVGVVIERRLPLWNSLDFDRDPLAVAEAARQENGVILGIPQSHVVIPP